MTIALAPTQSDALAALRTFLLAALPDGVEVVQGQDNRVPEPKVADFVTMTPIRRPRLATNVDGDHDSAFTASIAATVMTVTSVEIGAVGTNATLFGTGLAVDSVVGDQISGAPGGVGTYDVAPSQTLASRTLSTGQTDTEQATELVVQLDVHGPAAGDNAQRVATLFRSAWGVDLFASLSPSLSPLYCEDPRQLPFSNDQQQTENRWSIEAVMQANEVVSGLSQEFAGAVAVDLVSVEAEFAP